MKVFKVKHEMDESYRIMTLDEAFLEALSIAGSGSCEKEMFDEHLLKVIKTFDKYDGMEDDMLSIIKDEHKEKVIVAYGYEMLEELCVDIGRKNQSFNMVVVDGEKFNVKYTFTNEFDHKF